MFRVDTPHPKPFAFWEWLIDDIRRDHPRAIFLSEAFTRPRVMHRLAKLGFSQSYTYFTWRNTKAELTEYFTELAASPSREYFRPNVWPNTPDILPYPLQGAGPAAFRARLVLATTLAANYGIYGPAFELAENRPRDPGTSEEYLESEKYELKRWGEDRVLVVVNLDWRNVQSGWVDLDSAALEIAADAAFTVHDELNGERYRWSGGRNFVMLDPARAPAHVFSIAP